MKVVVQSVGVVTGGAASETSLGALFADAPLPVRACAVRPAPSDLRSYFRTPPERLARTDRLCQLSLAAVEAAGTAPLPEPVAVVHESGLATIGTNDAFFRKLLDRGARAVDPKRFPYTSPNAAAGEIAIARGYRGANLAMLPGLLGGLSALATGAGLLRRGRAASALVVGADALSIAAVSWLVATGQGIGSAGEGAVALVLGTQGRGMGRIESIAERFEPDGERSVRIVPDDEGVNDVGDLPGAVGLLAIARGLAEGRDVAVEIAGSDGVVIEASVVAR